MMYAGRFINFQVYWGHNIWPVHVLKAVTSMELELHSGYSELPLLSQLTAVDHEGVNRICIYNTFIARVMQNIEGASLCFAKQKANSAHSAETNCACSSLLSESSSSQSLLAPRPPVAGNLASFN